MPKSKSKPFAFYVNSLKKSLKKDNKKSKRKKKNSNTASKKILMKKQ
jgi:hypothetical protein